MNSRARRFFPPSGAAYELFDAAVFLFILSVFGYIVTSPTPQQQRALSAPLDLLPDYMWGAALAVVSLTAIVCSYRADRVRFGYLAMITACTFWSANFAIGMLLGAAGSIFPGHLFDDYQFTARAIISLVLYAWIASRLIRDIPGEVEE